VTNVSISRQRFAEYRLKAGIVEPERTSIAEQRFGKHFSLMADRITTNCSRWLSLFGSPEVIKGMTREKAQQSRAEQSRVRVLL
jgi:hypothetical protein